MTQFSNLKKIAIGLVAVAFLALGSAATAKADSAVINIPNSGLSGSTGPYATVNYTLSGGLINVTVTMSAGFQAFGTGDANNGIFGFNVVGSTAGLNITNLVGVTAFSATGGQMDGFGNFDVTLSCCNPSGAVNSFSFTVSRTGGFSSASDLFEANSTGTHFAVHIAPTNGNPTGFAGDAGTPTTVPEPASMLLLGTGLIGVAGVARRRFKARK